MASAYNVCYYRAENLDSIERLGGVVEQHSLPDLVAHRFEPLRVKLLVVFNVEEILHPIALDLS